MFQGSMYAYRVALNLKGNSDTFTNWKYLSEWLIIMLILCISLLGNKLENTNVKSTQCGSKAEQVRVKINQEMKGHLRSMLYGLLRS